MASGSVNLSGRVVDSSGAAKVGLQVDLYTLANYETMIAGGSNTITATYSGGTDAATGRWNFDSQALTETWVIQVTDGLKKYAIDADNDLQLSELDLVTSLNVNTIYEHTSGSGVTIDGVLIKDGIVTAGGALLPSADDTHDLGSASLAWQDLFIEGDITLTDAGSLFVADNSATAFQIMQGSDAYLTIDTANSSESVSIGTGISGTTVTLGHGTSTVAVTDDMTVGGDITVTGTTTLNGNLVLGDAAADTLALNATITGGTPLVFEGANTGGDNTHETSFAITDPTADRTITFPDTTLTVNAAADISGTTLASNVVTTSVTTVGVLAGGSIGTSFGTINNNAAITGTAVTGTSIVGGTVAGTTGTFSGVVDVTDTTDATDATGNTGALRTDGGASIAKKLYVGTDGAIGGDLTVTGDLTVNGDTITVDTATLAVEDPLIALATGNGADSLDVGFYGKYTATGVKYSGLFRDASDSDKWKLFATTGGSHAAPTTTVNTTSGFTLGTLVASVFEGALTGNADTVSTNANLTGHVTSVGNAAVLGSFTSAQLSGALTNESGSGLAVFNDSPTLITPALGTPASGVMTNMTGAVTASINDDQITLAKMAGLTRGNIIVGDSSDNPAALGVGSNAQVLTINGSGDAVWAAADSGGSMTSFQLEDDSGDEVAISNAKEVKFIGDGLTINWTDTDNGTDGDPYDLTFTVDASQTQITHVGALEAGTISSDFGTIDTGSSAITTTGAVGTGALTVSGDTTIANGYDLVVGGTQLTGIGDSTPTNQILGTAVADGSLLLYVSSATDTLAPRLMFGKSGHGTIGTVGAMADNELIGSIQFAGSDGVSNTERSAEILVKADGAYTDAKSPGRIEFKTTGTEVAYTTERMRIDSAGQVNVTATTGSTSISSGALVVDGGLGVAFDIVGGDDLLLTSSAAAITFNADVSLTHSANHLAMSGGDFSVTGGNKIFFDNGSNTYIYQESDDDLHVIVGAVPFLQIDQDITAIGIGPHVAPDSSFHVTLSGAHSSAGAATRSGNVFFTGAITSHANDTLFVANTFESQVVTDGGSHDIGVIAQLRLREPRITDNLTGDITDATTLQIFDAPSEGELNHALLISTGKLTQRDTTTSTSVSSGALVVGGGVGIGENLYVGGDTKMGAAAGNTTWGWNSMNVQGITNSATAITANYGTGSSTPATLCMVSCFRTDTAYESDTYFVMFTYNGVTAIADRGAGIGATFSVVSGALNCLFQTGYGTWDVTTLSLDAPTAQ